MTNKDFEFLNHNFLLAMNDIGRLGYEKYGPDSFHAKQQNWVGRGNMDRNQSAAIAAHASGHFQEYLKSVPHDKFNTRIHQLAAVAFNAMMEAYFDGFENPEKTLLTD